MAWNEGINFGLFDFGAAGRWVLVALALAIVAALPIWVRRGGWLQAVGAGPIIGGALGNVWDRLQLGRGGRLHQHELLRPPQSLRLQRGGRRDLRRRRAADPLRPTRGPAARAAQQDVTRPAE